MNQNLKTYYRLLAEVKVLLKSGRPGDYQHTKNIFNALVAYQRTNQFSFNPRIMFPAAILHDCGFGFIKKKHMKYFMGETRVERMRDAANALSVAFTEKLLPSYGFTQAEVRSIVAVIERSEPEVLRSERLNRETILLHDLNLLDRFSVSRIKNTLKRNSPPRVLEILKESISCIVLLEVSRQARKLAGRNVPSVLRRPLNF